MPVELHRAGLAHARELVSAHQYVKDSDWSDAQPSREDENDFIEQHDYDAFGRWHLAVDTDEGEGTKGHYKFPFGDFRRLHRSALIAIKQRAGEWDYGDVQGAADELLADVPED